MDSFGGAVPQFNIEGKTEINTFFGGVMSVLIITVTLMYAGIKGIELFEKKNPSVSDLTVPDGMQTADYVDFESFDFMIAFGFTKAGFGNSVLLDDPRYVKVVALHAIYDAT